MSIDELVSHLKDAEVNEEFCYEIDRARYYKVIYTDHPPGIKELMLIHHNDFVCTYTFIWKGKEALEPKPVYAIQHKKLQDYEFVSK